jgi:hypothetical protein
MVIYTKADNNIIKNELPYFLVLSASYYPISMTACKIHWTFCLSFTIFEYRIWEIRASYINCYVIREIMIERISISVPNSSEKETYELQTPNTL